MKHPSFTKQPDADTRSFPFRNLRTQLAEQRFNIVPFYFCAEGMRKDQFKGFAVLTRHG